MAIDKPSDTTEFQPSGMTELTQELRLATTITGGVSLAIWMAGVVRELNLLAQASEWRRWDRPFPSNHGLSDEAAASLKLYAQLINLLDTVVDVDVLSGTSAGGIGAALLASSRVTGSDLGGLRDLWLDLGALTDLLRNPTDKNIPSLLYGDQRMFAALAEQIPQLATGPFPPTDFPKGPRRPKTTLYATTTLLTGETGRFTDAYGTLVQDVDRRGVFTFTQDDLAEKDIGTALALAARSSASFPLAFEPSFIPFSQETAAKGGVPARPPMKQYANITRPHWVADGGLLDNQPIDVLLERIFDRRARRPVRRVLLFVVPSAGPAPSLVQEAPADSVTEPLGLVDGLLKDLSAATTQSIAAELRTIRAHQDRMEARTDTKLRLAELAVKLQNSRLLTERILADYATREATKQAQALTSALLRELSTLPPSSSGATESVPAQWEPELKIGGSAERTCRRTIRNTILQRWSQPTDRPPLPERPDDLARYGQSAYDLAKACALAVVDAAYRVAVGQADHAPGASRDAIATSKGTLEALAGITKAIHAACDPSAPIDLGERVRSLCTEARQASLGEAVTILADWYLQQSKVVAPAWDRLGRALIDENYLTLKRLAESVASVPDEQLASLPAQDQRLQMAVGQLRTYLAYLHARKDRWSIARELFDLAVTQRAMLPSEADLEQSLELVQVSADTRSLLAPAWQTAQDKLTGMQFHHFGAFYKRSWRANDWMWGRLDGAGWLVHLLLDPRRVGWIVSTHANEHDATEHQPGAQWFLCRLKAIGAPEFSSQEEERELLEELAFLDDRTREVPPSIPNTAMWLAQPWQQRILDEELEGLAKAVLDPEPGKKPDWSPTKSRSWAERVVAAKRRADEAGADGDADELYTLLNTNPVARETLATDKGSPLMAQTITKAAATASAAVGSIRQLPSVLRPPLATVRTVALGGFRVVSSTKGIASRSIIGGAVLLVLGVAIAILSSTALGAWGLILAGIGGYAIVLGAWQLSTRLFFSAIALALLLGVLALTTRYVREWLFGTDKDHSGVVGAHVYWLGTQWWHPLIVIGAVALAVTLVGAINPRRK
jgi:patatin-related protein